MTTLIHTTLMPKRNRSGKNSITEVELTELLLTRRDGALRVANRGAKRPTDFKAVESNQPSALYTVEELKALSLAKKIEVYNNGGHQKVAVK